MGYTRELTDDVMEHIGIPKKFNEARIRYLEEGNLKKCIIDYTDRMRDSKTRLEIKEGVLIQGASGSGKTFTAVIVCKAFYYFGSLVHFTSATEMQRKSEDNCEYEEGVSFYQRCRDIEILAIDDLGSETVRFKGPNYIKEIIRYRHEHSKLTIINTTLLCTADIDEKYGNGFSAILFSSMMPLKCINSGHNLDIAQALSHKYKEIINEGVTKEEGD